MYLYILGAFFFFQQKNRCGTKSLRTLCCTVKSRIKHVELTVGLRNSSDTDSKANKAGGPHQGQKAKKLSNLPDIKGFSARKLHFKPNSKDS